MLIGTLMASIPVLMLMPVPVDAADLLNLVLGFFLAKGGDAVAYLLNSTAGSNAKTDAMVDMSRRQNDKPQEVVVTNASSDPVPTTTEDTRVGGPRGPE